MKNQERAELYQEYHSQVKMYNEITERVVLNKFEMSKLWLYKNDYPADWVRKAEMLSDDRQRLWNIKHKIISLKAKMRKSDSEHPQR
ncbi:MAG: hypothetical protein IIX32_09305 [Alistipes sp.]|nr:hypothetical protein [Alistipes sp.]